MTTKLWITVGLLCLVCVTAGIALLPTLGQADGGPPMAGGPGMGGPGMGGPMGPPPSATVQMIAADGVIYAACDGKVIALEAKTLKQLAEATVSERPQPPAQPGG